MRTFSKQLAFLLAVLLVNGVQSSYKFSLRDDAHLPAHIANVTGADIMASGKVVEKVNRDKPLRPCEGRLGPERPCMKLRSACYCFIPLQRTWKEAYEFCDLHEMFLLSIQNIQNQLNVQRVVPQLTDGNELVTQIGIWTSGTFISAMSAYTWMTSPMVLFSFVNWMYGCPLLSSFDCVRIIPSRGFIWSDIECDQWLPFICESSELEVVEPELPSTSKPEVVPETSTSKPPPPEPENPSTGGAATNSTEPPPTVQPGPVTFSPSKPGESLESVHIHVSISVPEK